MTHLALQLPEIVSNIVSFLLITNTSITDINDTKDKIKTKSNSNIYQCLFINRLWNDCTIRILWRKVAFVETKTSFDAMLKLASVLDIEQGDVKEQYYYNSTPMIAPSVMIDYSSHSSFKSTISSIKPPITVPIQTPTSTIISPFDPCYSYFLYNSDGNADNEKINHTKISVDNNGRLPIYRNALRSLSLYKVKEKSIHEPLCKIGAATTKIERLNIYICDHFTKDTLSPFLTHGSLTYISLAGCHRITDDAILEIAKSCEFLEHLDLRACGLVSDISLSAIATHCPRLKHLNVGRVRDKEKVTIKSIRLIAQNTQVTVLGLAGCDVDDACLELVAKCRRDKLERISANSCSKISNHSIYSLLKYCSNLSVFEMKDCHLITHWEAVAELVKRQVLLTLCEEQIKACEDWSRLTGKVIDVKFPLK